MSKDNKNDFKNSIKVDRDSLINPDVDEDSLKKSKENLEKVFRHRYLYEKVKIPYLDTEVISENQIVNLSKWNKEREYDEKYNSIKSNQETRPIYKTKRRAKKKPSKSKGVFKKVGALGLTTLVAMGILKWAGTINDKPIKFQQAKQCGMDVQTELGLSKETENELNTINKILEDKLKLTTGDAYKMLKMINYAYNDVLTDKVVSATNTTGTITFGSRFEDGGTVEYVSIRDRDSTNLYFKDSIINSIVGSKTIPQSMANAIGNWKDTQTYIMKKQEDGDDISLGETLDKCEDLNNKLNEYAAVQISYNRDRNKFDEHIIKESELPLIAEKNGVKLLNSNESKSNNSHCKKLQNAIYPGDNNDSKNTEIKEYDDGR